MQAIPSPIGVAPAKLLRQAGLALLCLMLSPYAAFLAMFVAAGLIGRGARRLTALGQRPTA